MRMIIEAPRRGCDSGGCGYFNARRGARRHKGQDYNAPPGSIILPEFPGRVTKLGYTYANDLSYRYVQIECNSGYQWRYFYTKPMVKEGAIVDEFTPIGTLQDVSKRYKEVPPHLHLEVRKDGKYYDPEKLIKKLKGKAL